jgi:RNA polymerase sigma-70 factor (ECF subfamily)
MVNAAGDAPASQSTQEHAPNLRREIALLLPDLRAYSRFLVRDRSKSDDLVQDTVVRALASLDQFAHGTNLRAWMFTILRNAFYEQMRRRKREDAALALHAQTAAVVVQSHHGEIADLSQLLWTLPPLLREALVLVGAQEMTHEEAASICGVPVGTMRARVSRARRMLSASGREYRYRIVLPGRVACTVS